MWEIGIQNKMLIPAKSLKQEINDSIIITILTTLKYFQHSLVKKKQTMIIYAALLLKI